MAKMKTEGHQINSKIVKNREKNKRNQTVWKIILIINIFKKIQERRFVLRKHLKHENAQIKTYRHGKVNTQN